MNLQFGSQVLSGETQRLGELRGAVCEPEGGTVIALVCRSAHFGERELLVPLESVQFTDDVTVQLDMAEEEFESLQDYSSSRNVAPPPDRDHADPEGEEGLPPSTDVPPVGAATGIESIAFTPIVQESVYIPTGDEVLDGTTEVWATDGQVGTLRALTVLDGTGTIGGLLVREGTVFVHDIAVPGSAIAQIRSGAVVLSAPLAQFEARDEA
jgi:uncharacterized protein YrrD